MYFLSEDEKRFFGALCETIVPSGSNPATDPGALTVGATGYIDSCLHDFSPESQRYFKSAIGALDQYRETKFSKKFAELDFEQRNRALKEFYLDPLTREKCSILDLWFWKASIQTFYHDPKYTGKTAWEYVEFGGKRISDLKKDSSFLKIWKDSAKK